MLLEAVARIEGNARRLLEILRILAKYGLADWLGKVRYEWLQSRLVSASGERLGGLTQEARIRLAATELGATFIKLGQACSTRPDLIPAPLAAELSRLQSDAPRDPPDVVRATIRSELGADPGTLFAAFDDEPLASASIGQVHRARLPTGQGVVVKVQHAGIESRILRDLDIMAGLAELLERHVGEARPYQPVSLVRQFRRALLRELDFTCERRNLEAFARNFAHDETVRFPAVHGEFCGRRVLTMEFLEGVRVSDRDAVRASGADLGALALRTATMYVRMIFRDGFYHADPHPGNYFLLPGGVLGVLDCGMVGRLDEATREDFEAALLALIDRDTQELTELVVRLGAAPADLDRNALRADIGEFCAEYGSRPISELDLGGALTELTNVIRRHRIVLPAEAALLLRMLVILEGTLRQLSPEFSLMEVIEQYQEQAIRSRLSPQHWLRKLRRSYRDWDRLLAALPGDAADLLRRLRNGTLEVKHGHRRLEAALGRLAGALLTSALFLGSAELWGREAPPLLGGVSVGGVLGVAASLLLGLRLLYVTRRADNESRRP
jgi:ubiquinone biosynthesis protein